MADTKRLKLTGKLDTFPEEIFESSTTLEQLDLSGTGLSSLPPDFASGLPRLKILFLSSCNFKTFPVELAECPELEMVAFRSNNMTPIPENSLPPRLRWLILTDNQITSLPRSIGTCNRLQKCMLAGNCLQSLPDEMRNCRKLGLLRLSSNLFETLPDWIFHMPQLAFLSFAGNPCTISPGDLSTISLPLVPWSSLNISHTLGQGASGVIFQAKWQNDSGPSEVAVKLFKGLLTSDGRPEDEMSAVMVGGQHSNIIDCLGCVADHPESESGEFKGGLVMQLIPPQFRVLGLSPSMESCTRDCYPDNVVLSCETGLTLLNGVAAAARHLTDKGISHGDLFAHNILYNDSGNAFLGDFGAATVYRGSTMVYSRAIEKLEVLAFAHLIEDVIGLIKKGESCSLQRTIVKQLVTLHEQCCKPIVDARLTFREISGKVSHLMTESRQDMGNTPQEGDEIDSRIEVRC